MNNYKTNINEYISKTINRMLIDSVYGLPFYGQFNLMINFRESSKGVPTCGVNVSRKGMNFYYNPEFIDSIIDSNEYEEGQKQINFIVIHENFHLLFNHPKRVSSGKLDPELSNIAQDMIINSIILEEISEDFVSIPKYPDTPENIEKGINSKNMALFIPKEYDGELIFEELYNWLKKKKDDSVKDLKKSSGEDSQQQSSSKKPDYGPYGKSKGEVIDSFSVESVLNGLSDSGGEYMDSHLEDEVSGEYKNIVVKESITKLKNRGFTQGNSESALDKLRKKRKDHLKYIKKTINNEMVGKLKHKTITRPNRRGLKGLKGNKKYSNKINVIFDSSGSMIGQFEKVLEYIFQNDIEINVFHIDTNVNKIESIKSKKDLQNMNIFGMGGTILQPAVDGIVNSSKYNKFNSVILTDGYCDDLDLKNLKGSVIGITCGKSIPIKSKPKKGYKEIIVED